MMTTFARPLVCFAYVSTIMRTTPDVWTINIAVRIYDDVLATELFDGCERRRDGVLLLRIDRQREATVYLAR